MACLLGGLSHILQMDDLQGDGPAAIAAASPFNLKMAQMVDSLGLAGRILSRVEGPWPTSPRNELIARARMLIEFRGVNRVQGLIDAVLTLA